MVHPESSFDDEFLQAIRSNNEMGLLCLLYKAHSIYGFSLLEHPEYKKVFNIDLLILSKIDEVKTLNTQIVYNNTFDDKEYDYEAFFNDLQQYMKDNQYEHYYVRIQDLYNELGNISDRQKYRIIYCKLYNYNLEYCVAYEELVESADLLCFRQLCKWKRTYLTAHFAYILDEIETELGTSNNDIYKNGLQLLISFYNRCNLLNVKNMKSSWLRNNTVPKSLLKVRDIIFDRIRDIITNEKGEINKWYQDAFSLEN